MRTGLLFAAALFTLPSGLVAQATGGDGSAAYQQRALEILRTAVGYRTAASHGQVPALANYLADQFREGGFPEGSREG